MNQGKKTHQYVSISKVLFGGVLWFPESSPEETVVMVTAIKSPPAPFKEIRPYEKPRLLRRLVEIDGFVVRAKSGPRNGRFFIDSLNGEALRTDQIEKALKAERAGKHAHRISIAPVIFTEEQKARVNQRPENGLYNNGKPMKPLKVEQTG